MTAGTRRSQRLVALALLAVCAVGVPAAAVARETDPREYDALITELDRLVTRLSELQFRALRAGATAEVRIGAAVSELRRALQELGQERDDLERERRRRR